MGTSSGSLSSAGAASRGPLRLTPKAASEPSAALNHWRRGIIASPLAVGLVECGLQPLRELGRSLHTPEVHVEEAWGVEEPMVMDRGHADARPAQRPGARMT